MSKEWFYARVSSKGQNLARQIEAAHELGIPAEQIVQEKMSGKNFSGREAYLKLKSMLQAGDVLYVMSVDRLGRNYDETYAEWQALIAMGVDIVVLDMPLLDTRQTNKNGLDGKFVADLVLKVLTYVAQKERDNNRERQMQGYAAMPVVNGKKVSTKPGKEGRTCGREALEIPALGEYVAKVADGILSVSEACAELGISRNTWYRRVNNACQ